MKRRIVKTLALTVWISVTLTAGTPVRIDIGNVKPAISEYIYGQFIEHLGRCIYGGLWAEMIEDRKFYYPVTDDFDPWAWASDPFWNTGPYRYLNASPWKVIGPAGSVIMDSADPYVGDHTPVLILPGEGVEVGISQDGLGVVADKKYTGRILLAGDAEAAPVSIRLVLDEETILTREISGIHPEYRIHDLIFKTPVSSDSVRIEIAASGRGRLKIGTLSLMPADHIRGWRKDVVALLKELDSPIYRWPGGNFVSGYNWRDGIGERDLRPPRKNPAWKGVEHNDVGIHEYMELMDLIGAEPFVAVNTGLGTVEEVAEEVAYCNSPADSPMGRLRALNGHPEPYKVTWWAVGNEMYGDWQLGHMPLEDYVRKHIRVAEAMWAVDPGIRLIGVGSVGEWSETMMKEASGHMDLISEHIYCREIPDVTEHALQLSREILRVADAHRVYRKTIPGLAERDIRIAMDEWNYWYGDYIYGELGVRYHHKDALGVAMGLHEFFRNSDLYFMANYAQTVNVIGCIKTTTTDAAFAATGLPLKLYRRHFGVLPVDVSHVSPVLDVAAALTAGKTAVTVALVNPANEGERVRLDFGDTRVGTEGKMWMIHHPDPQAYNEPGREPAVTIREQGLSMKDHTLDVPAFSIVLVRFGIE